MKFFILAVMDFDSRFVLLAIWLATVTIISVPAPAHAQDDYAACTSAQYDHVRTESEIAGAIAACSHVLEGPSSTAAQRARAFCFRGLNHFLRATNFAVAARKPIGLAGEPGMREVNSALEDLAASMAASPQPGGLPFSLRATIYTVLGQHDSALADLERAIGADPNNATHYVQRALILERLDRFGEARADLDAAVKLDPANQSAWIKRAKLWTRYGNLDQAFSDYDRAAAISGNQNWDALNGRARLAVRLGDPARGFADWTKAAELAALPMLKAQAFVRAGNLARDYLKDFDGAQQAYARALATLPTYADALIQRGLAYERIKRFDEAASDYRKAIELTRANPLEKPSYDYAQFRLEVLRARLSRRAGDPPLPPNINVLTGATAPIGAENGRRIALVIGNAAYAHVTPLANSDRDAASVGIALSDASFATVTVATNLDRNQMEAVLQQFAGDAAKADWAVIYYAGHGIEADGVNYAIPVDASLDALREAPVRAISIEQMVAATRAAKDLRLVVLDACRDNPFAQEAHRIASRKLSAGESGDSALDQLLAQRKAIGGGLAPLQLGQSNTVALFSTQPGHITLDGEELNSPFTRAFIRNIPTPSLDLRSFFERVRDDVGDATQGRQRPTVDGHLREGERFFFFPTR